MRNINQDLLDGLASEEYRPCVLIALVSGDTELYYTTWDCPVFYDSKLFYSRGMEFGSAKYGTSSVVDNIPLKIDDTDRVIYSFLSGASPGAATATVTMAVLDSHCEVLGGTDIFVGTVSEWSYSPTRLSCRITSIFVQWANVTTHVFSGSCRWTIFKGTECKYVGDATECDRKYDTCEAFENTINFGGFRWTQSLEDKEETKTYKNPMRWPYGRR